MRYDYDMFSLVPDEVMSQFQGMLGDGGAGALTTQQTALWRDPAVVKALKGADQAVKDLFIDAGFGLDRYESAVPVDRFLAQDKGVRDQIEKRLLDALTEGLESGALTGANWNGFVLSDFLEHLQTAKPIDQVDLEAHIAKKQKQESRATTTKYAAIAGMGFCFLVFAYSAVHILFGTTQMAAL